MSQTRPHPVRKTIAHVLMIVMLALLPLVGMVGGLAMIGVYGYFDLIGWSSMTRDEKIVLIACPSVGGLIGALFGASIVSSVMRALSTGPQQASTSHTQRPGSSSIGMTHCFFQELMSKLMSLPLRVT